MQTKIKPLHDYLLIEVLEEESSVVKTEDIRDTQQRGKVLEVGPGTHEYGAFITPGVKPGDIVFWEEAADANTPASLQKKNQVLIKFARLIAREEA